jgi:two-component system, NarL family, response regulator DesR
VETARASLHPVRTVLAEDKAMVLGALAALLEADGDLLVVAQARTGKEALEAVVRERPEVLVTDVEMPKMSGLDVVAELKRLRLPTKTIIVTAFGYPGYLRRALEAGVAAYLLKDKPAKELANVIRKVNNGMRVIDPELAREAWSEPDPLTKCERQALRLASEGLITSAIAKELVISEGTVRNRLSEVIQKLGAHNRAQAARIARIKGWL